MPIMPFVEIGAALYLCLLSAMSEATPYWLDVLLARVGPMVFAVVLIADAIVRLGVV